MKKFFRIAIILCLLVNPFLAAGDDTPLSKPCQVASANDGYFFDDYIQHEYIGGLLTIHFKIKTPFNDGRAWQSTFYAYKPDCSFRSLQLDLPGFAPRPKMQSFSIRFISPTRLVFWDDEEDVPFQCGDHDCTYDLPQDLVDPNIYSTFSYYGVINLSSVISGSLPIVSGQIPKEPVLVIPGMLGTEIEQTSGNKIWPNLAEMAADPNDRFMDALNMDQGGRPIDGGVITGNVLGKIDYAFGSQDYSSGLIEEFAKNGYVPDNNLFLFPYDWRLGLAENAAALKNKITKILAQTGAFKLNVIAHSLGGLIVKEYLKENSDPKIDNLVFVGTPHFGSVEAAQDLIFGSNLGIPLLSSAEIQKLSQNMPSIYELLPSAEYYKHSAGFYDDLSTLQTATPLNYEQSKGLFMALGKNSDLLKTAESEHAALDNLDFSTKVGKIFNIIGCGQFTLKTINKMYEGAPNFLKRFTHGPKYRILGETGDGTVLINSASALPGATQYYAKAIHSEMLSDPRLRSSIVAMATGAGQISLSSVPSGCDIKGKLLSLNSSLEINITDLATGKSVDPSLFFAAQTGQDKHLFFPSDADQKYKITVKHNDAKTPVDLSVAKIQPAQTVIYNYDQINVQSQAVVQLTPDAVAVDNIDPQGNDQAVSPSDSFDQNEIGSAANPEIPPQSAPSAPEPPAQVPNPPVPPPIYVQIPPAPAPVEPAQPADSNSDQNSVPDENLTESDIPESPGSDPNIDPSNTAAANSEKITAPGGSNVNITFQFPTGLAPAAQQRPAPADAAVPQPYAPGGTIIISDPNPSLLWRITSKLLRLIFF